jgi:apolipoprotein N-acyltransferase
MADKPIPNVNADSTAKPHSNGNACASAMSRRAIVLHFALATALGALNTLSFAPTPHGGWLELAIFALAFWLVSRTRTLRGAALTGGAFGFGNFVTGVWWLYVSMHFYGEMPALIAGAALVLFSLYLAIYPALSAAIWYVCTARSRAPFQPSWHASFAFASAWAVGEWLRGMVFTGFPWLASGYAQVDGPLAGFAPIVGAYGVGWVLALVAALVVQAAMRFAAVRMACGTVGSSNIAGVPNAAGASNAASASNTAVASNAVGAPNTAGAGLVTVLAPAVVAIALLVAGMLLKQIVWTQPTGPELAVRLLQGNVKQSMKFEPTGIRDAIALYQRLITEKPADLVVTPETAIPVLLQEVPPEFGTAVRRFVDTTHTSVIFGSVGATLTDRGPTDFTNALFGVTPGSNQIYRYDKHHLVPFGEFIPWGFRWFVDMMKMPLGDFARGAAVQPPFVIDGQSVALDICYEDIFGEEIARTLRGQPKPASILINATNLGWFGDTIALDQHLQIARMRSIETGRPMLRATNTGATAMIDADGSLKARLPSFTVGALDVRVQGRTGATPYIQAGNTTVLAVSLVLLAIGFGFGNGRERKMKPVERR